jgi:hypothetical protein
MRASAKGRIASECMGMEAGQLGSNSGSDSSQLVPALGVDSASTLVVDAAKQNGLSSFFAGNVDVCLNGVLSIEDAKVTLEKICDPLSKYKFKVSVGIKKIALSNSLTCNLDEMEARRKRRESGNQTDGESKRACMRVMLRDAPMKGLSDTILSAVVQTGDADRAMDIVTDKSMVGLLTSCEFG